MPVNRREATTTAPRGTGPRRRIRQRGSVFGSPVRSLFQPSEVHPSADGSDDMEWEELIRDEAEQLLHFRNLGSFAPAPTRENSESQLASTGNDSSGLLRRHLRQFFAQTESPSDLESDQEAAEGILIIMHDVTGLELGLMPTMDPPCPPESTRTETATSPPRPIHHFRGLLADRFRRLNEADRCLTEMQNRVRQRMADFTSHPTTATVKTDIERSLPAYTSLLTPGMEFKGYQKCLRPGSRASLIERVDDWAVHAQIQRYDTSSGFLCGTMAAYVKHHAPVKTYWKGEIVDNKNHTFVTDKWSADTQTDLSYWNKFSAFRDLKCGTLSKMDSVPMLSNYPYIFMRWKETYFIQKTDQTSLTIQGFYYICMNRRTGEMTGYYYDPDCQPFQKLELSIDRNGRSGFAFSEGSFL